MLITSVGYVLISMMVDNFILINLLLLYGCVQDSMKQS